MNSYLNIIIPVCGLRGTLLFYNADTVDSYGWGNSLDSDVLQSCVFKISPIVYVYNSI